MRARKDRAAVETAPSPGSEVGVGAGTWLMLRAVEAPNKNWKEEVEFEVGVLITLAMDSAWSWQNWASCSVLPIGRRTTSTLLVAVGEASTIHLHQIGMSDIHSTVL